MPYYFKYFPTDNFYISELPKDINFYYSIVGKPISKFRVRPSVSVGNISIYNPINGEWVSSKDTWLNMPILQNSYKLKLNSNFANQLDLYFIVQDMESSKLYETPKIHFWTPIIYTDYLNLINAFITQYGTNLVE